MKRVFLLILCGLAVAFNACSESEEGGSASSFRPSTPVVTETLRTSAVVTTTFSASQNERVGFFFGEASVSVSKYREVDATGSGTRYTARLTNLAPDTDYCVYAFIEGRGRFVSEESASFRTQAGEPGEPVLTITGESTLSFSYEEATGSITYRVTNPVAGKSVSVQSDAQWVHSFDTATEGTVTFAVDENRDAARTATITVSYPGADPCEVTVKQAAEEGEEQAEPTFSNLTSSDVTTTGATLSGTLAYDGTATIQEVAFCYKTSSGSEQKKTVTASTGAKSVTLTGLTASTTYTFYLSAKIGGATFKSTSKSFTTSEEESGGGNGNEDSGAHYSGWAELPVEVAKSGDYYYAYHMRSDKASQRNYSICYSADKRCAIWTAMPIHSCYDGNAGRNDDWDYDPIIPKSVQPDLSSSYKGVYSRGHMVASSDRQVSVATNRQTFYYTNMAPQYQDHFNGGIWQKLETWCWDKKCSDTLYVVTGAHFSNTNKSCTDADGKSVKVPTHFYKLLIRSKSGNTGKALWQLSSSEIICVGFWFEHNESYATNARPSSQHMKSVADIETLTGFTFFPNVPNAPKSSYKASDWGM